jgi:6-hydroxycyclohex-1-ene-1-carbonyl-CoA dehydrogenase
MLSVIADAVTTPYEAIRRSGLGWEDVAVIVGAGGVGGFGVQIAAALGAAVVAIDVDRERLDLAARHGAGIVLDASSTDLKGLKVAVRAFSKESARKGIGLKIFEMSGTPAGQTTAFGLLDHGAYLGVVGFTPKTAELRLSNLMAFDATARGNWGCPPDQYPAALKLVLEGKVTLAPFIEFHSLEEAPDILDAVAKRALRRRVILRPNHSKGKN